MAVDATCDLFSAFGKIFTRKESQEKAEEKFLTSDLQNYLDKIEVILKDKAYLLGEQVCLNGSGK